MVTLEGSSRFYARNSAGKYQLEVDEIRSAFIASESLAERLRRFRSDRIAKIVADEAPLPLVSKPKIVLHVVPISFASSTNIDLNLVKHLVENSNDFRPIDSGAYNYRYNFDGFLI